jgi:two-component system cell cycle sensor histidine kinase/response regulator CckA
MTTVEQHADATVATVATVAMPELSSLAAIVESSEDAIVGLTLAGIITSWNPAAERLYGYSAAEMVGGSTERVTPSELHEVEHRLIARVAGGARIASLDTSRIPRTGGRLIISLSLFPIIGPDGAPIAIASIERDVTRQRALEAQLLQAKRMQAVGRLAGGVAQEFNNVNTAIIGLVDFITADLPVDSPSHADLLEITAQATRGSRLAKHLLSFSGRQDLDAHDVPVDHALQSLQPLLQRLIGERGWLTLELTQPDARVRADESQLELVIFELVINAADAIGAYGTITIATKATVVDGESIPAPTGVPVGRYLEIVVTDSGPGMTDNERALAFDPFYTTKDDEGHLGLGLAMVYGVIRQLEGYVDVTRAGASGTQVSLFLPLVRDPLPDLGATTPANSLDGSETILVVEDEEPVRAVICRGLRAHGYAVLEARHGEDALVVVGDHNGPVHLVVSDVVMPHMDGRALFERLRSWYPQIRFLFISGYTRGIITGSEVSGNGTEFLAKPFSVDELCERVRRVLDGARR